VRKISSGSYRSNTIPNLLEPGAEIYRYSKKRVHEVNTGLIKIYDLIQRFRYGEYLTVTAQSVQRWATGWTIGVLGFDSRRELGIFLHRVQNVSGALTVSYPMGTGGSFPGGKATGA
jgi:hypothetical protein